jgi:hypothetical protein
MIYSLGEVPYEAVPNQFRTPEFHYYLMYRYEFKDNHGEWITSVKPELGPGISERVWEAVRTTGENIDACPSVKTELHAALATLLQVPLSSDYKTWIYSAKEEIFYLLYCSQHFIRLQIMLLFTYEFLILAGFWYPSYPYCSRASTETASRSNNTGNLPC